MKKGVTLAVVLAAIVIMMILVSTASVVGSSAISTANFEKYKAELSRVNDDVNLYIIENGNFPSGMEVIVPSSLSDEFKQALSSNNDLEDNLFVVDASRIKDASIENGKGSIYDQDVYLVSQNSKNIYYLKGYKYKNVVYYCSK